MRAFQPKSKRWPQKPMPATPPLDGPPLSVIVICYEMEAQIKCTLHTLLPPYQQDVDTQQYEVVIVDNGSTKPLPTSTWSQGDNVRYVHVPKSQASVNPGLAINWAVAGNRSPMLCIMIDGARLLTPRVLRWGMDLAMLSQDTLVEVRGWDLGPKPQIDSVAEGYTPQAERKLLDQIDWPENPYQLFDISAPPITTKRGFLGLAAESTCLFLSRSLFDRIGGYDERYREPGGGLCNVDFFHRAVMESQRVFTLLGEGTFHQFHNGSTTALDPANRGHVLHRWRKEYQKLSRPLRSPPVIYEPVLAGHVPAECRRWLRI